MPGAPKYVQLNTNVTLGKKVKVFESTDVNGNIVESQSIVVVDSDGNELSLASEAGLTALANLLTSILTELGQKTEPLDQQHVTVDNSSIAVTGPLTNVQLRAADVQVSQGAAGAAPWLVVEAPVNATRTTVPAATQDTVILAANPLRRGAIVFNNSMSNLYIALGTAPVSTSDFTYILAASSIWEVPLGFIGVIRGIWVDTGGAAQVTELT